MTLGLMWLWVLLAILCLRLLTVTLLAITSGVISVAIPLWEFVGALPCLPVHVNPSVLVLIPFGDPGSWWLWSVTVRLLCISLLIWLWLLAVVAVVSTLTALVSELVDHVTEERHFESVLVAQTVKTVQRRA